MSERLSRPLIRRIVILLVVLAVVVAIRVALEPRRTPATTLRLKADERKHVADVLTASALDRTALLDALAPRRVLLLGESHFAVEPQTFVAALAADLHARDGRRSLLVLELPATMQKNLDRYMATGDEAELKRAWAQSALPYQPLVRWARAHPEAVSGVVADDEPSMHIALMRLFLTDTRNATMARTVADGYRTHPSDRIIAFGGRLHMMKSGRYLYDSPTRSPIGARLRSSVRPDETAVVWLLAGDPPADATWTKPGAVSLIGAAGTLPIPVLEDEAVFGVSRLQEIVDYAVYLGPATRIPSNS